MSYHIQLHERLKKDFPNLLPGHYKIASHQTPLYNCIAWAAGCDDLWWWPDEDNLYYWPEGIPREVTIDAFIKAFEALSYFICNSAEHEEGYEKIAIYVKNKNIPTHASRQVDSEFWTSKLGQNFDILHQLEGVSGPCYGRIAVVMKRRISCQ